MNEGVEKIYKPRFRVVGIFTHSQIFCFVALKRKVWVGDWLHSVRESHSIKVVGSFSLWLLRHDWKGKTGEVITELCRQWETER
ncbi:uncharacterized protein LACBIDRAFT_315454 [Laccaria bicolor S238N-H82]|uniref:Predicted protein n=1 Tax=Laccaria bicolor (strain S238N-H82 / ATCC MYA-4686) TaxID=486041 RepID=B0D2F8_LACBS|nr:uncharacterized protein LACBIDRAFT_315454 [Laccaria bicolor S238N-H82]EDR11093.1 predicted protein [Laccaria bicolor S238N-H82]|eukprot:XP_001878394.1 predicted protein [Laccaria bicolor S238N-H82]